VVSSWGHRVQLGGIEEVNPSVPRMIQNSERNVCVTLVASKGHYAETRLRNDHVAITEAAAPEVGSRVLGGLRGNRVEGKGGWGLRQRVAGGGGQVRFLGGVARF